MGTEPLCDNLLRLLLACERWHDMLCPAVLVEPDMRLARPHTSVIA